MRRLLLSLVLVCLFGVARSQYMSFSGKYIIGEYGLFQEVGVKVGVTKKALTLLLPGREEVRLVLTGVDTVRVGKQTTYEFLSRDPEGHMLVVELLYVSCRLEKISLQHRERGWVLFIVPRRIS